MGLHLGGCTFVVRLIVSGAITALFSNNLFGDSGMLPVVSAWNKEGHEAIAMTAMSAIEPQALGQLKRLLNDQDLVDIANWGHLLDKEYPATDRLHFELHEEPTPGQYKYECPDDHCLTKTVNYLYARLSGASDIPSWQPPSNLKFSDMDALKLLVNLIGDLHQPLHVGRATDNGGRSITGNVTLNNHKEVVSLFTVWDDIIIAKVMMERSYFWNSGWTHVNFLQRGKLNTEKETWRATEKKTDLFAAWAKESADMSKAHCYKNGAANFNFTQTDAIAGFEYVRQRILLAGLRTALVVNTILNNKDTIKLRRGSGVNLGGGDRPRPRPIVRASQNWMVNLTINVSILILVLAVALCVSSRLGRRTSPSRQSSVKEKTEDKISTAGADMQMAPLGHSLSQTATQAVRDRKDGSKQS